MPKAPWHFLGGALVGAGSQLTYRYLLERFARANYAVIATPFRLSFDYESVCDAEVSTTRRARKRRSGATAAIWR